MNQQFAKQIFNRFAIRRTKLAKIGALTLVAGLPAGLQGIAEDQTLPEQMIAAIQGTQGNAAMLAAMLKAGAADHHATVSYYLQTDPALRNAIETQGGDADRLFSRFQESGGDGGDGSGGSDGGI